MDKRTSNLIKSKLLTKRLHDAIGKFQAEFKDSVGTSGEARVLISFDKQTIEWSWETKDNELLRSYEKEIGNYD